MYWVFFERDNPNPGDPERVLVLREVNLMTRSAANLIVHMNAYGFPEIVEGPR